MTLDEIIADLQAQLDWRGPGRQPQGHIVIPRSEAQELLNEIKDLREIVQMFRNQGQFT